MKEITPTGWLIDDGGAWQFTTKSEDLAVAKRFNWKITPLYSEQSLADIRAEAVMSEIERLSSIVGREFGEKIESFLKHYKIKLNKDHANKIRGG